MLATRLLSCLAFIVFCAVTFAQTTTLKVLEFYEFPAGVYNAILKNVGTTSLPLHPAKLENLGLQEPVHAWWIRAQPATLSTENAGFVQFTVMRAKTKLDKVRAHFPSGLTADFSRADLPLLPVHTVQDATNATFYVYLRNPDTESRQVTSVVVNGNTLEHEPLVLLPGQVGVWTALSPAWERQHIGEHAQLTMTVDGIERHAMIRVFDSSDYRFLWEHEAEDCIVCPTHQLGPWAGVGERIFNTQDLDPVRPATVHFCRNRLPDGLAAFAQCTPRSIANLQASNLTRGKEDPWPGWHGIADIVKSATEPGIFTALIEDASQYSGAYGVPATPEDPPLKDDEIRPLLLLSVAKGSKGLLLRPNTSSMANDDTASSTTRQGPPSATARSRFDDSLALLERHLPWLSVSEPVPAAVVQSAPGVAVLALLCGDKGLILLAFKNSDSNGLQKASIEILTPPGCPVPNRWKDSITGATGVIHATSQRFVLEVPLRDMGSLFQLMREQEE